MPRIALKCHALNRIWPRTHNLCTDSPMGFLKKRTPMFLMPDTGVESHQALAGSTGLYPPLQEGERKRRVECSRFLRISHLRMYSGSNPRATKMWHLSSCVAKKRSIGGMALGKGKEKKKKENYCGVRGVFVAVLGGAHRLGWPAQAGCAVACLGGLSLTLVCMLRLGFLCLAEEGWTSSVFWFLKNRLYCFGIGVFLYWYGKYRHGKDLIIYITRLYG